MCHNTHTCTAACRRILCRQESLLGRHSVHYAAICKSVSVWVCVLYTCVWACVQINTAMQTQRGLMGRGLSSGAVFLQAAVGLRLIPIYIVAYFRAQWPMASRFQLPARSPVPHWPPQLATFLKPFKCEQTFPRVPAIPRVTLVKRMP